MQHVIFGILLFLLGIWGIVSHWYQFLDLLWVRIFLWFKNIIRIFFLSIISNLSFHFQHTSLFNQILILVLLVGGIVSILAGVNGFQRST